MRSKIDEHGDEVTVETSTNQEEDGKVNQHDVENMNSRKDQQQKSNDRATAMKKRKFTLSQYELSQVHEYDVLSGRDVVCFRHVGNLYFRKVIAEGAKKFAFAQDRKDRAKVILWIIRVVASRDGKFLKQNVETRLWIEMNLKKVKEKVKHAVRDALTLTALGDIIPPTPKEKQEATHSNGGAGTTTSRLTPSSSHRSRSRQLAMTSRSASMPISSTSSSETSGTCRSSSSRRVERHGWNMSPPSQGRYQKKHQFQRASSLRLVSPDLVDRPVHSPAQLPPYVLPPPRGGFYYPPLPPPHHPTDQPHWGMFPPHLPHHHPLSWSTPPPSNRIPDGQGRESNRHTTHSAPPKLGKSDKLITSSVPDPCQADEVGQKNEMETRKGHGQSSTTSLLPSTATPLSAAPKRRRGRLWTPAKKSSPLLKSNKRRSPPHAPSSSSASASDAVSSHTLAAEEATDDTSSLLSESSSSRRKTVQRGRGRLEEVPMLATSTFLGSDASRRDSSIPSKDHDDWVSMEKVFLETRDNGNEQNHMIAKNNTNSSDIDIDIDFDMVLGDLLDPDALNDYSDGFDSYEELQQDVLLNGGLENKSPSAALLDEADCLSLENTDASLDLQFDDVLLSAASLDGATTGTAAADFSSPLFDLALSPTYP